MTVPSCIFRQLLCFCALSIGLFASEKTAGQSQSKPELDVPEVVFNATTPELMKGQKEQISTLEGQNALRLVSDTVSKSTVELPDALQVTDQPILESPKSCFSPCFGSPIATLFGSSGRFGAAAKAYKKGKWLKAAELLMPIAMRDPPEDRTPEALYFVAQCNMNLGDPGSAAGALDRLRRVAPTHHLAEYAVYELGWIYLQSGNYERATEMADRFRSEYPSSPLMPYARYLQSAIHYANSNYRAALIELEGIVAGYPLFPYLPETQFWVAENRYYMRELDASVNQYTDYLRNFPDGDRAVEALYGRAFARLDQSDLDAALEDFQVLIQRFPQKNLSFEAAYQTGKIYILKGDSAAAIRYLKLASQMESKNPARDLEIRAWIEYESSNYARAHEIFGQLSSEAGGSGHGQDMAFMAALCLYQQKQYSKSAAAFQNLAQQAKGSLAYAARANAGIALMRSGQMEAAIGEMDQALASPLPLRGYELYALYAGEILYRLGRFEESRAQFESLRDRDIPEDLKSEIDRGIAWNLYTMKNWKDAATAFGGFARQYAKSRYRPEALLRQAECLFNMQDYETARVRFAGLIEQYPIHPEALEARLLMAQIDGIQGRHEDAIATLDNALRMASQPRDRQRIRMLLGDMERNRGDFSRAAETYRTAYLDHPESDLAPAALIKQADCIYSLEDYTLAVSIYRQIIDRFPTAPEAATAQYSLGLTYFQTNRLDEYLKECQEIARNHPGTPQAALALSGAVDVLIDQKRYDEAIAIYRRMVDDPNPETDRNSIHFKLAKLYAEAGRTPEASEEYRHLMEQSDAGLYAADAAMELSDIEAAAGHVEEANRLLQWVIEHAPNHPRISAVLLRAGRVAFEAGQYASASQYLQRLVEQFPGAEQREQAWLMLALIGVETGRCAEHQIWLEQASRSADRSIQARTVLIKARCLENDHLQDDALQEYLKITYLFHDVPECVIEAAQRAGDILTAQKKPDDAAKMYAKARSLREGNPDSASDTVPTPSAKPAKEEKKSKNSPGKPSKGSSKTGKSTKKGQK